MVTQHLFCVVSSAQMSTNLSCPDGSILKQFLLGQLPPEEVECWAEHVESCPHCIASLEGLRLRDTVIETMRKTPAAAAERSHPLVQSLITKFTHWRRSDLTQAVDADVFDAAIPEVAGHYIGVYRLVERIGEGGMGSVWVADQEHPVKRRVALKVIKPGMASAQVIHRFEAERQALALMDHNSIATVLDAGTTDSGRPYFVMELVPGKPITKYCDEQRLTIAERLELFLTVCQAIQHAHQKSIIHRDIKPSNILVCVQDGKPVAKVIDFGVAKAIRDKLTDDTMMTEFGAVVGTLEYMSPEQAALGRLDIDTRSDVYSLGILLYELLTGSTPLGRERPRQEPFADVLRLIREEDPAPLHVRLTQSKTPLAVLAAERRTEPGRLVRQLHGELDWIVMKALEKDRDRRYEAVSSLARDVNHYLHGEPVEACPPSASYKLRKFLGKHKGPAIAASLIVILLVAGIIGTTWGLVSARRERDEADQQAAIARAVNDFLQKDLLSQADLANQNTEDGQPRDPDIKVRTLLDLAAKKIDHKFAGQPLTEAAIRMTVGDAYVALGQFDTAKRHLEKSVELRTAVRGADHADTLASKNSLAELLLNQGNFTQAEPLLLEVVAGRARQLGKHHHDTLTSKHNLAALYFEQGKYGEAEALFQEVVTASTAKLGTEHADTLASKNGLALVYQELGVPERAEPLLTDVLQVSMARLGGDHPHTLRSKNNLAMLYQSERKYALAEPLLQEVLQARIAKLGSEHPHTLSIKENVALLLEGQGKYPQAETLLLEVQETRMRRLGKDHPDTLRGQQNLAVMLHAQKKHERAAPILEEVVRGWVAKLGPRHPDTLTGKSILAGVYRALKKSTLAESLYKEVLQGRTISLGAGHPRTLHSRLDLAAFYQEQGKHGQAERLLRECLASSNQNRPDAPTTLRALEQLVQLYEAWGKPEQAAECRKELATRKGI